MKHTVIKSILSLGALVTAYMDGTFGPLIWALLILVGLDLVLNLRDEAKQLSKIGSGAVTLGLPALLTNAQSIASPAILHAIVAVLVLAYLQVVYPQVMARITKWSAKVPVADAAEVAALKSQVATLTAQTRAQAQSTLNQDYHLGSKP